MDTTRPTPTPTRGLAALVAVLACLSAGATVLAAPASAQGTAAVSARSGGDDDPAGDDHGGTRDGSDDPAGDDHGGTRNGSDDPAGDDHGGTRSGGGDDDRVIRTGTCRGRADWKLKVKTDDGRLEVEGEVDSNRTGQAWRWVIRHNGSVTARGTSRTSGRSGSFSVERKVVNLAGTDRLVFRARYAGQVCRGVVNY